MKNNNYIQAKKEDCQAFRAAMSLSQNIDKSLKQNPLQTFLSVLVILTVLCETSWLELLMTVSILNLLHMLDGFCLWHTFGQLDTYKDWFSHIIQIIQPPACQQPLQIGIVNNTNTNSSVIDELRYQTSSLNFFESENSSWKGVERFL